ncbi:hypothetical protein I316_01027 [Kwoniella heveanensis BCC8398]|uniref:F-box domain-containing protein n=1 Tax=Kwoniella heveanensis BCC8398 TaxID=1296120 RepID=A0A1B9H1G9_9TREE|nr:hypothetical protein I316_01027 [Kwoniella heveanensis BCC8398]
MTIPDIDAPARPRDNNRTDMTSTKRPLATPRRSLPAPTSENTPLPTARGERPSPRYSLSFTSQSKLKPRLSIPSPQHAPLDIQQNARGRLTPRDGPSTPRPTTPRTPIGHSVSKPSAQLQTSRKLSRDVHDRVQPQSQPTTLPQWAAHSPVVAGDGAFPEIFSEPTNWDDPITEDGWELRTEPAGAVDEYDDSPLATLQAKHLRQITHYKNLLVRSQSASSSSLHDLHSQLHTLQREYNWLRAEHAKCSDTKYIRPLECFEQSARAREVGRLEQRAVDGMREDLEGMVRGLTKDERVRLLGMVAEACHPSDINAQIEILEKYKRSRYDILSRLDENISIKILSLLEVTDILRLRTISRGYRSITKREELWRILCRQLEWRDWDAQAGLKHLDVSPEGGWEELYKSLWRREMNWNAGLAQKVFMLKGHTNYVTSLRLRGDVLISGSYDETIRIWHLPPLLTLTPSSVPQPLVLPAKSVSCLDYHPPSEVFVAGYHDIGRVQVWRKKAEVWGLVHTLSGHLHGIRAVALNEHYLVSAGADKALVVWSWRTGEKIVRFGQQTNICIGIQLIHDYIVAVTVDGVIRTFDIRRREMLAQYKISDLAKALVVGVTDDKEMEWKSKLRDIGGGQGGVGMINWFEGQGRWMTCATREIIIRLGWNEVEEEVPPVSSVPIGGASATPAEPATPSPVRPRIRTVSSTSRALPSSTPTKSIPLKQRAISGSLPSLSKSLSSKKSSSSLSPNKITPMTRPASSGVTNSPSPLKSRSKILTSTDGRSASPLTKTSSARMNALNSPIKQSSSPESTSISRIVTPSDIGEGEAKERKTRIVPLLTKPPKLVELIDAPDVEKGAVDARRTRVVTSTRFAARAGANRHLYIGVPRRDGKRTEMKDVGGAWASRADELNLQTPEKNPMSLVLDREKFVYGCTDGSIVVVGFVGHDYLSPSLVSQDGD